MKKKTFILLAVVSAMLLMMSVSAFATVYYDEDFSDVSVLADTTKITYSKNSAPPAGQESIVEIVTDDIDVTGDTVPDGTAGTIHMKNSVASGGTGTSLKFLFPTAYKDDNAESVFMYDMMLPNTSSYNTSQVAAVTYFGGVRHNAYFNAGSFYSPGGTVQTGHTPGVWYTYLYALNKDKTTISIYRKLQSADDSQFALLGSSNAATHGADPGFEWSVAGGKNVDVFFDNMKLYSGENILSQEFTVGGTEIAEISEVAEGEFKASVSLLSNKGKTGLNKLFVAYDKHGKLLGCTIAQEGATAIHLGHNEIAAVMNLNAENAAAIADGGYVGLYVWDGMIPAMSPFELQ